MPDYGFSVPILVADSFFPRTAYLLDDARENELDEVVHFEPEPGMLRSLKDIDVIHSSRSRKKPIRRPVSRRRRIGVTIT